MRRVQLLQFSGIAEVLHLDFSTFYLVKVLTNVKVLYKLKVKPKQDHKKIYQSIVRVNRALTKSGINAITQTLKHSSVRSQITQITQIFLSVLQQ